MYTPPNAPSTPLIRKATRLSAQASPSFNVLANSPIHNRHMLSFPPADDQIPTTPTRARVSTSVDNISGGPTEPSPGRFNFSMQLLESESQALRLESRDKGQGDTGTGRSYGRHVNSYDAWWNQSQVAKVATDPRLVAIPAFPITAAKVAMFLQYESTREKKKHGSTTETIPGSSIGKSQIGQVISALESHRANFRHKYKLCAEAQIPLRNDERIRQYEKAAKHDEPKRAEMAQATKAAGSSSDTYSVEELRKCARWCLLHFKGPQRIYLGIRDRAMLLMGAGTAFRGDSARILLWSDLFKTVIQLGDEKEAPVLGALADNAKHNQTGRIDEHGLLRHKHVELCGVSAVALMFFGYFHIAEHPVPDFSPDFSDKAYGEYGRRDWYKYHVFSTGLGLTEMSYQAHHDRVTSMHSNNDVSITKVTHSTRSFAAQTCRSFGASVTDTKALGGWNESGSFKNCYNRALPVPALLGAAFFPSSKPELYRIARNCLVPPDDVLAGIFPWIEAQQAALLQREHANRLAKDIALRQFLTTMAWFRRVLAQDAAVLYTQEPLALIFKYTPFNSPSFRNFAATSAAAIAAAEEAARLAFHNLPQHLVASMQGVIATQNLLHETERQQYELRMHALQSELGEMKALLQLVAGSKRKKISHGLPLQGLDSGVTSAIFNEVQTPIPYYTQPGSSTSTVNDFTFYPSTDLSDTSDAWLAGAFSESQSLHFDTQLISSASLAPQISVPLSRSLSPSPQSADSSSLQSAASGSPEERQTYYFQRFGEARFRKHSPEWLDGDWVPHYRYITKGANGKPVAIWDIWMEWAEGVDGYISVRDLNTTWGAKWRRGLGVLRNENTRRTKVINLINILVSKRRWDVNLAKRFITEQYSTYTARAFSDYVKTAANEAAVIAAAANYP